MLSNRFAKEKLWQRKLPIKACPDCFSGKIVQIDYDDIDCITCNGKGVIDSRKRSNSIDQILLQINNKTK